MIRVNGRRGAFLVTYGVAYVALGYSYIIPNPVPPKFIHEMLPTLAQIALWAIAGLTAIVSGFMPYVKASITGFTVLSIPLGIRLVSYAIGFVTVPDIRPAVSGTIIFGAMLITLMIMASLPEPKLSSFLGRTKNE